MPSTFEILQVDMKVDISRGDNPFVSLILFFQGFRPEDAMHTENDSLIVITKLYKDGLC